MLEEELFLSRNLLEKTHFSSLTSENRSGKYDLCRTNHSSSQDSGSVRVSGRVSR
jgi:hypothetical protein